MRVIGGSLRVIGGSLRVLVCLCVTAFVSGFIPNCVYVELL